MGVFYCCSFRGQPGIRHHRAQPDPISEANPFAFQPFRSDIRVPAWRWLQDVPCSEGLHETFEASEQSNLFDTDDPMKGKVTATAGAAPVLKKGMCQVV